MNPAELVGLALEIGARIDVQWGLFVTVHLAIFGAIIYIDQPLAMVEKLVSFVVYLGFSAVNFSQMQLQLALLDAVYTDVHALVVNGSELATLKQMSEEHLSNRHQFARWASWFSHGFMLLLMGLSIAFDQALTNSVKAGRQAL